MSNLKFLLITILSASFFQCNQNLAVKYKKDLLTGFTIVSSNLTYLDIEIQQNNEKLIGNHISLGSHLTVILSHIHGFSEKNQMVFPGASLKVSDRNNKIILNQIDLFSNCDGEGIALSDSKFLKLSFQTGSPMEQKQMYLLESTIWDKNGSGTIVINFLFKITKKSK